MFSKMIIDLTVSESLFECCSPILLSLNDPDYFTCHGVIKFTPTYGMESEHQHLLSNLQTMFSPIVARPNFKRASNYSLPYQTNKLPVIPRSQTQITTLEKINSGSHITGFQKIGSNQKIFACDLCGRQSSSKAYLTRHVNLVHKTTAVLKKCDLCDFTTKWIENVKRHYTSKHNLSREEIAHRIAIC